MSQENDGALPPKGPILRAAYDQLERDAEEQQGGSLRKSMVTAILIATVVLVSCVLYFFARR